MHFWYYLCDIIHIRDMYLIVILNKRKIYDILQTCCETHLKRKNKRHKHKIRNLKKKRKEKKNGGNRKDSRQ